MENLTKKVVAGVTFATAITSAGVAHADEVQQVEPVEGSERQATQDTVVTKPQVDSAKAELGKAQFDVSSAEGVDSQAQSDLAKAQENVASAEQGVTDAEKLVEEATPENINLAKADVVTAQGDVASKEVALNNAKQSQADAENKVSAQEGVVTEKQTAVDNAKSDVSTAKADVDTAQKVLDGTGASAIIKHAEDAQKQQESDTKAVEDNKVGLEKAKQADADRLANIDKAQASVDTAQNTYDGAKAKADEATSKANETSKALSQAQTGYDKTKDALESINTLVLSDEYIKNLKVAHDYSNSSDAERRMANTKVLSLGAKESANNTFKHNKSDQAHKLDLNNLTQEEKTELALFAARLSSQVRKQAGTAPVDVTPDSVLLAWDQSKYYQGKIKRMRDMAHDTKYVESKYNTNIGEDLSAVNYNNSSIKVDTMDKAKEAIYNAYKRWLFSSDESFHAASIAGVDVLNPQEVDHVGIGITQLADGTFLVNYAETDASSLKAKGNTTFNTTAIPDPASSYDTLLDNFNTAKTTLANAKTANDQAQSEKRSADSSKQSALNALNTAKGVLSRAVATPIQTPSAQDKLDKSIEALAKSTEENKKAQQAVADLNADIKVKQAKLAEAKSVLASKEKALADAEADLSSAKSALADLKANVEKAKAGVSRAQADLNQANATLKAKQDRVADLGNAPQRLADAKARLEKAQADLDEAIKNANASKERLAELVAIRDEKKAIYEELLSRYTAQQKRAEAERILKETEERLRMQQMSSRQPAGYFSHVETDKGTNQADLPSTGDKSTSAVVLLGMGLLSLVGVSAVGQRRRGKHSK